MEPSTGVVVPAFRPDADLLVEYVDDLVEGLDPERILVELDDPDPATLERLRDAPADVETVPYRRGKGSAITAGFEALDTEVLAFADADGATPVGELERILDPIARGDVHLSTGSRRHPDAKVSEHQTTSRRFLGDGFAWVARRLLDVDLYDYQCGAKAITSEAWSDVRSHIYASGFAWDIELVAVAGALGYDVAEVPIEWHDKPGSTVSTVRTPLAMARGLLVARHRAKQLQDSRIHRAIANQRSETTALVDEDR